ncbi:hypothetical protein Agub_g3310 [Astrephomene gubernaculifera]|uniref:Uncharacterized protein n=1 Tax=Astrephomene gubernaculifera TaxID=47775 RepID=A0AAD3HJ94_9CHLO|nr:hypothetical protein Agub_g3310 [Astrephomene gubernaculifera]
MAGACSGAAAGSRLWPPWGSLEGGSALDIRLAPPPSPDPLTALSHPVRAVGGWPATACCLVSQLSGVAHVGAPARSAAAPSGVMWRGGAAAAAANGSGDGVSREGRAGASERPAERADEGAL